MEINLNDNIIKPFLPIVEHIVKNDIDRLIMKGGRGSTKSQAVAISILTGVMVNNSSAVCCLKYGNKLEERLVNTFKEAIRLLEIEDYWKLRRSPLEYVLLDENKKESNYSIKFTGCDEPENLKSYKPRSGSFGYIWFEELTNFKSLNEVNSLIQSFGRGSGKHMVICTYNPPMRSSSWVNKEYNNINGNIIEEKTDSKNVYTEFEFVSAKGEKVKSVQLVNHSTYLDVIESGRADWLGTSFIAEAKKAELKNNKYYRFAYLGEVVGTDANVFNNIIDWDGNTDELDIKEIKRGFDWGYGGKDQSAYGEWYYNRRENSIYALNEYYKSGADIDDIVFEIKKFNKHNFIVSVDCANPLLNRQLEKKGINVIGAKKWKDSVRGGIAWLQNLNGIYICKTRTPHIYNEFSNYEYKLNKEDEVTSELNDANNHTIDACRYAFGEDIRSKY